MRPIVAFDIDGVLADFLWGWTRLARKVFGEHIEFYSNAEHTDWAFDALSQEEQATLWRLIDKERGHGEFFWLDLPGLTTFGDEMAMLKLSQIADIVYITSRFGKTVKGQTEDWLGLQELPAGAVIIAHDKLSVIREIEHTRTFLGIIEDKPSTIRELHLAGVSIFVRDWQYNRIMSLDLGPDNQPPRVSSVAEFAQKMLIKGGKC